MAPVDRAHRSQPRTVRRTEEAAAPTRVQPRAADATPGATFTGSPLLRALGLTGPLASLALPPAEPPPGLTIGDTGRKVKRAETMLKRLGFAAGPADGKFTRNTESAVKEFQAALGLPATGRLDDRTFTKIAAVDKRARKRKDTDGVGEQSAGIKTHERRLKRLGYDVGRADGIFDRDTAAAVQAFKADQKNLKSESGLLGQDAKRTLRNETERFAHAPFHARKRLKSKQHDRHLERLDARVANAAAQTNDEGVRGFGRGSRGKSVEYVQQHLRAAGFDPKRTDGRFDERTEGALRNYQRKEGIRETGRVDPTTWRHLKKATLEAKNGTSPHQDIGERSGAVKHTEKLLNKLGFDPGQVDGRYTEGTQRALDRFRKKRHLRGIGDGVGPNTLDALERAVKNMSPFGKPKTVRAYSNGAGYNIQVVRVDGKFVVGEPELVRKDMAKSFLKMYNAAHRDGVDLRIVDGFRTNGEQAGLYAAYLNGTGNPANPPGYSEHQKGRALDLNVQTGGSDAVGVGSVYNWLANNAHRYGFRRIASEAWHWEYTR